MRFSHRVLWAAALASLLTPDSGWARHWVMEKNPQTGTCFDWVDVDSIEKQGTQVVFDRWHGCADEQTGATDPTEENEGVWEMIECDKRLLLFPDPATQKWVVDEPLQSPEGDEVYSLLCGK
jgi:hypothetical protein